jgi:hypothetical protein
MAQAQVTITAVDRTQAAINSAMRSMKTLERTAKVTAKAVNLAFGLLTGSILVSAFGKITEAAKKTEEGRRALDNFNKALKDPALVAAANSFTTTLINGFTEVIKFAADAARAVTKVGRDLGVLAQPVDPSQLGKGEGGRRGRAPQPSELNRMENQWKFNQQMRELDRKRAEEAQKASQKMFEAEAANMRYLNEFYEKLKEAPDLIETSFAATDVTIAKSVQNILDEMNAADQIMANFAQSAAQNIQSAFAEFLFDPFKGGLKGMLSSFLDVTRRMLAELAAQQILGAIFGSFTGGTGFMASFAKAITGRASGGPVSKNTPYIVGERGPELFVPGSSGGIVPNNAMMGGGMTVAPVYNIDARGATADLQSALPGILQENNRRIFEELDRRYGVGR